MPKREAGDFSDIKAEHGRGAESCSSVESTLGSCVSQPIISERFTEDSPC